MGIFDRFKAKQKEEALTPDNGVILSALLNDGSTLTKDQIKDIPQVAADLDMVTSIFATIPFRLYRRAKDDDGNDIVIRLDDDTRVRLLNYDTNDTVDPYMLKKAMCEDYFIGHNGGGYAYIDRDGNTIKAIRYVKSDNVAAYDRSINPIFRDVFIAVNAHPYEPFNFLKLLRNSKDGVTGESIVDEVNAALKVSYEALKYQYGILRKGGSKKGFLQTNHVVEGDALDALRENWKRLYSNDNEKAVILNAGLEFKETSSSTAEMQLDETKQTLNKEIDAIFHMSDDLETFIRRAVLPIGTAFETALNSTLLLEREKADHYWEADYSELLKASMRERFTAYKLAKESGWVTVNEIRKWENLKDIEGMDVLNVGLSAALYSVDGDLDRDRFYVPNTDTAERKQIEDQSAGEKGDNPDE